MEGLINEYVEPARILRKGKLVTIEYDPVRARELAENIKRAGFADIVQVVAGDAFVEIPNLAAGEHTFYVVLGDGNHVVLNPLVADKVTVTIQ